MDKKMEMKWKLGLCRGLCELRSIFAILKEPKTSDVEALLQFSAVLNILPNEEPFSIKLCRTC